MFDKYKPLGLKGATQKHAQALMVTMAFKAEQFACGSSKLFLKSEAFAAMEKRLVAALRKWAVKIQALVRMFVLRSRFVKMKEASALIGKNVRIMLENARLRRCVVRKATRGEKKIDLFFFFFQLAALVVAKECERRRRIKAANLIKRNWKAVQLNRRLKRLVVGALVVAQFCESEREKERERLRREEEERRERLRKEEEQRRERERERVRKEEADRKVEEERKRVTEETRQRESLEKKKASKEEAKRRQLELIEKEEQEEREREEREKEEQREKEGKRATPPSPAPVKNTSPRRVAPPPPTTPIPPTPAEQKSSSTSSIASLPPKSPRTAVAAAPVARVHETTSEGENIGLWFASFDDCFSVESGSFIDDETQNAINEVNHMACPSDPMQTLTLAKQLQRKIKVCPFSSFFLLLFLKICKRELILISLMQCIKRLSNCIERGWRTWTIVTPTSIAELRSSIKRI